jgi:hypothetical protein
MALAAAKRASELGVGLRPEAALPMHAGGIRYVKNLSERVYDGMIAALEEWGVDHAEFRPGDLLNDLQEASVSGERDRALFVVEMPGSSGVREELTGAASIPPAIEPADEGMRDSTPLTKSTVSS